MNNFIRPCIPLNNRPITDIVANYLGINEIDEDAAVPHNFWDIAGIVASMTEDDPGVESEKVSNNIFG